VNEKKSEAAETPEDQPEPSSVVRTDGESKSKAAADEESSPAPTSSSRSNGATAKAATEKTVSEKASATDDPNQSLGTFLIAARERRGLTAAEVVAETRLPAHYLQMMETNDYSKISDRLYLVPFLRRYASFLALDQEDVAMRFVREVQRADSIPPARLDQPLVAEPHRRRGWTGAIVVVGFLAVAAGVYLYESDRHRQAGANNLAPNASAGAVTGSDSAASGVARLPPTSH
jgi:Helix-turn-helix domain